MSAGARAELRALRMAAAESDFASGDLSGLYRALVLSVAGNESAPEWARQALYRIEAGLNNGEIADMNEAFGWPGGARGRSRRPAPQWARELLAQYRISVGLPVDPHHPFWLR